MLRMRRECTPLMFAAAQGRLELVEVLLTGGVDADVKAADGSTP